MEKLPVREITGEVFAYESEFPEKVRKAFEVFFPKKEIKQTKSDGAFGTKIIIFRASAARKKAQALAETVLKSLRSEEKEHILKKSGLYIDESGRLYLRFDKQIAFENGKMKFTFEEEGSVQIVMAINAYPGNEENYRKVIESIFK